MQFLNHMQTADYSKHFASKACFNLILSLLNAKSRSLNQLQNDLKISSDDYSQINNTINFLMDEDVIYLDDKFNVALRKNKISEISKIRLQLDEEIIKLLNSPGRTKLLANALQLNSDYGLCIDGFRISKNWIGLLSLYYSFGIITFPHKDRFWPIKVEYVTNFIEILPLSLDRFWEDSKAFSYEDLKKKLANQEVAGAIAEQWILEKEKKRLKEHPLNSEIKCISNEFVNAGFDIASFKTTTSVQYDKFIEVKSYGEFPRFFLSSNEIEKARLLQSDYYLIIVDRTKMQYEDYSPIEIINPYNILLNGPPQDQFSIKPSILEITIAVKK